MLETLLAKIGLPVLLTIVMGSLRQIDNPVTQSAAGALAEVEAAITRGQISQDDLAEANRHTERLAELENETLKAAMAEINQSLRTETASQDAYVRRMRPTFGYLMALTWAAQMFGIAYVIIWDTGNAGIIISAMSHLSAIWAVGLSVLGIYVYKRSEDKKLPNNEMIFWKK